MFFETSRSGDYSALRAGAVDFGFSVRVPLTGRTVGLVAGLAVVLVAVEALPVGADEVLSKWLWISARSRIDWKTLATAS